MVTNGSSSRHFPKLAIIFKQCNWAINWPAIGSDFTSRLVVSAVWKVCGIVVYLLVSFVGERLHGSPSKWAKMVDFGWWVSTERMFIGKEVGFRVIFLNLDFGEWNSKLCALRLFLRVFCYRAGGEIQTLTRKWKYWPWKQCNVRRMASSAPPLREWGRFEKLYGALPAAF